MRSSIIKKHHVALDFSRLDDTNRHDIVAAIAQGAASSQLVSTNQAMQISVGSLVKKSAALKQASDVVTLDKQKLKGDISAEAIARAELDGELLTFATMTEASAKSPADIDSIGLVYRAPAPTRKSPPVTPDALDVKMPKRGHGKATVSANETGKPRLRYVAEWSPDPMGPNTWSTLVGTGKSRTVTGASGERVWVRFATVRGQLQSDWSTPVLVTIP